MAQDAELKLKVSLDLAYFRQRISTISTELAGQAVQLNVQFNKKSIADQYRLLNTYIGRKNFDITITSKTLDKLVDKVGRFKKNLATLGDEEINLAVNVVSNIDEVRKSIKSKLPSVGIDTKLNEPVNVDDFVTGVSKKVDSEVKKRANWIGIATKLEMPGITAFLPGVQQALDAAGALKIQAGLKASVNKEDIAAFKTAVSEKLAGITVKIKVEPEGIAQVSGGTSSERFSQAQLRKLGQDIKPLYRAAGDAGLVEFNDAIQNNVAEIAKELSKVGKDSIEGLLNGLKSKDAKLKAAAENLGKILITTIKGILGIASPSKVFKAIGEDVGKGFELGAVASMDRAFDTLERKLQERLKKLQSILSLAPSRRSAFPFVATGGALESGPIAREIDQAYAQIAQIQERRQGRLAAQRGGLAQMAGRLLPPARDRSLPAARETILPGGGALDQVTKGFVQSLRDTRDTLARNFSANTYLPRATRALASSMEVATKQLTGTKIAGLLPSKEMMEPLRFQRAQQRAAQIDAENIARHQAQQAAQQASLRGMFEGVPRINAPRVGQEETAIGRHIQNKVEQAIRNARQTLGLSIGPSSPYVPNPFAGAATVPPRQYFQAGGQAALPPAGGTGPWAELQRGTQEMLRRNERMIASTDRAMAALDRIIAARSGGGALPPGGPPGQPPSGPPNQPPGGGGRGGALGFRQTVLTPEYFENAKKYSAALEMARATSAKFTASQLPLIGGLREVAGEFGFAIKQVLLFGTAYKGLAFVQSLPGQILNAAKSQQQYNNALQTATQDTGTFAKELLYVDNVQRAFGLNLETTRDGFTKLYASMGPTGFDSGSIEKLFTGISAATAALQLTPDKAERVIYAFGQMASKGQIMSEELKGQLGDVLPGALAIFAKAAGMSVKEFSQAMEDGEFVGSKFRDTFAKVADELMRRFGTGAQAAGKSLQGLLNTVQGDFKRTLESFAPLANAAAQAILGPLGGSLKQLSMSAQIATGEIERTFMQLKEAKKDLGDLRLAASTDGIITKEEAAQIKAAEQNVAALTARYKALQQAAQDPAIAKQAQDIQLFTQELAKAGAFVMNTAKAIGGMLSPILNILGTNLTTVISLVTSFYVGFQTARLAAMALMGILLTYRALSTILGFGPATLGANALAGAFNVLGVAASGATVKTVGLTTALRVFAATTILGAIVGGIMLIAGAFGTMRDRAQEAAQSSRDAAKAAVDAAATGNVAGAQMSMQNILAQSRADKKALETLRNLRSRSTALQREGGFSVSLTPEESAALQGSELTKGMLGGIKGDRRQMQLPTTQQMQQVERDFGRVAQEQKVTLQEAKAAVTTAQQVAKDIGLNVPTPPTGKPEAETPDEAALKKAQQDAEQAARQEQQRRIEQAGFINDMEKLGFDYKMQLSDEAFEHQKRLIDERNQYELSGLNEIQAHQVKFAQDLKRVRLEAEDAIRKAIQKTQEAQLNVTAAQRTAQAAGVSSMGGQAIFGNTGRTSQAAGWVHGHFQTNTASLATLIGDVVPVVKQLLSRGIPVELSGRQKFNTGMSDAEIISLLRKGASQHTHSGDGRSIDLFVPKGTAVPTPLSDVRDTGGRGGITGVLPGSGQSWVGHLDPRSKSGAKQSSASFSMDTKMQKESFDLQKQYAQSANQTSLQMLEIERAIQLAKEQTATIIRTNIDTLFPVEQQKLDIRLQQMRHNLLMQGMPQEYIDYEEKRAIATEKAAGMTKTMIAENDKARKTLEDYNQKIAKGIELLPSQKAEMAILNDQIKQNEQGLKDLAKAQQESNIASLESAIATMKQADALKAMEEVSGRINDAVEGVTGTYKALFKEIAMGGDSVEALKKAQQALADQFLTMVFDMAMKPVEESMKNSLSKMFGVPTEKEKREESMKKMEEQLTQLKLIETNTAITAGKATASGTVPAPAAPSAPGQTTVAGSTFGIQTLPFNGQTGGMLQTLPFNGQTGGMLQNLPFSTGDTGFLSAIGINSKELSASISESANAYSEQLGKVDASVFESANALGTAGTELSKEGAAGKKWHESLGQAVGGLGMAAGAVMGIVAGINQIKEGGTSNVLGGIGMIASMAGSLLGGFSGLFGGGQAGPSGGNMGGAAYFDPMTGKGVAGPNFGLAKGGIIHGGFMPFRAFANGGIVTGPTMGLVGEGRYSEAVVPLPDGRSIPVQLGGASSRELLSGGASKQQSVSPVLSMSFQTTKFGDKEYVDIDQLQAAMAETRKMAAREGAAQGSQLALTKLRNSPSTRRQLGLS